MNCYRVEKQIGKSRRNEIKVGVEHASPKKVRPEINPGERMSFCELARRISRVREKDQKQKSNRDKNAGDYRLREARHSSFDRRRFEFHHNCMKGKLIPDRLNCSSKEAPES
jgi:hypothetical protein